MTYLLEHWKPVVGYEMYYEVSNIGHVRRIDTLYQKRTPRNRYGYHVVHFSAHNVSAIKELHTVVAAAFLGPRPDGHEINHKDLLKSNNRASNLEYITRDKNVEHYWSSPAGNVRKVPDAIVADIKASYPTEGPKQISLRLGMSYHTVYDICRGKRRTIIP